MEIIIWCLTLLNALVMDYNIWQDAERVMRTRPKKKKKKKKKKNFYYVIIVGKAPLPVF